MMPRESGPARVTLTVDMLRDESETHEMTVLKITFAGVHVLWHGSQIFIPMQRIEEIEFSSEET